MADSEKRDEAMKLVKKYCMYLGGIGIVPVPVVQLALLPGLQLKMVHELADLYDVKFSKDLTKALLAGLTAGTISMGISRLALSLLKSVPAVGQLTSIVASGLMGGASTYAIGKLFTEHFETGGTLLTVDSSKMKTYYEELIKGKPVAPTKPIPSYAGIKP